MRKTKLIVIFLFLVLSLSLLACTSTEASNGFYTVENGSNSFTMLLKGALVNSMGYKTLDLKEDNNLIIDTNLSGDGYVELKIISETTDEIVETIKCEGNNEFIVNLKAGKYLIDGRVYSGEVSGTIYIVSTNVLLNSYNEYLDTPKLNDFEKEESLNKFKLKTSWEAIVDADGYEIAYSEKNSSMDEFGEEKIINSKDTFYEFEYSEEMQVMVKVRAFRDFENKRIYSDWSDCISGGMMIEKVKLPDYEYVGDDELKSAISKYLISTYGADLTEDTVIPVIIPVRINETKNKKDVEFFGNFYIYICNKFGNKIICKSYTPYRGKILLEKIDDKEYKVKTAYLYSDYNTNSEFKAFKDELKDLKVFDTAEKESFNTEKTTVFKNYIINNNLDVDVLKDSDGSDVLLINSDVLNEEVKSSLKTPVITGIDVIKEGDIKNFNLHSKKIDGDVGYEFEITEVLEDGTENVSTYKVTENVLSIPSSNFQNIKFRVRVYSTLNNGISDYSDWSSYFNYSED